MIYTYKVKNNQIVFNKPLKKGEDMVRVYFTRQVDEREMANYPLAYASVLDKNVKTLDWFEGQEIIEIMVKDKFLFGLISKWVIAQPERNENSTS